MKKLKFNDLVNAMLQEDNFLQKIGKGAANWASRPSNWVGAAAAAVNAPKAVHTAVTGKGQIGRGLNALQGALAKREQRKEDEQNKQNDEIKKQQERIENFDKDFVSTILMKSKSGAPEQQTTAGSVQATGTVTGGTATPAGASGTSSGSMSAPVTQTSAPATPPNPREGDVFAIVGQYGRVNKYKIKNIDGNVVSAEPVI